MFLKLRILFTILSAICLALILPAMAMGGWTYLSIFGGGAVIFFLAMLICKQKQEELAPSSKIEQNEIPEEEMKNTEE